MQLLDCTWPTTIRPKFKQILWGNQGVYSQGTKETNEQTFREFAAACRDGNPHWKTWSGEIAIIPGTPVALDFELDLSRGTTPQQILTYVKAFHDEAPGVRLTLYTGFPGIVQRESVIYPNNPTYHAWTLAGKHDYAPIFKELDFLCFDSYMLGKGIVNGTDIYQRDLQFIKKQPADAHQNYPNKDIFCWITGYYTWDASNPVKIAQPDLKEVVDTIYSAKYDGIVVWGDYKYNDDLIAELEKR